MGKNKLKKFADMEQLPNVFQLSYNDIMQNGTRFLLKGCWGENFFGNNNPIVLELGCGKGEYAVELARRFPEKNFIGVDIKGARMWTGAMIANQEGLNNCAFIRTGINVIDHFFDKNEVSEIWITFADPQMKKVNKRLTSTYFLSIYKRILAPNGVIHLKTDSNFLFTYTSFVADVNKFTINKKCDDIYADENRDEVLNIKTYYERQWLSRGITIKYLQFLLSDSDSFIEPEVEIEFDDYRSFGRQKRSELDMGY